MIVFDVYPDKILFDPETNQVFIQNEHGQNVVGTYKDNNGDVYFNHQFSYRIQYNADDSYSLQQRGWQEVKRITWLEFQNDSQRA